MAGRGKQGEKPPPKAPCRGQRCIDNTVWDTMSAQHGKRPHQTGRCEEVLSPVAASNPWRPAIANAGLIERLMWDILKHRTPKPTSRQAIGLLVVNPPSSQRSSYTPSICQKASVNRSCQNSDFFLSINSPISLHSRVSFRSSGHRQKTLLE